MSLVSKYLEYHKTAWAETTLKSETRRLRPFSCLIVKGPEAVYQVARKRGLQPYSIKTLFIRLAHLEGWALDQGEIKHAWGYKEFKKKNANIFKGAYQKKTSPVSYQQAAEKVSNIPDKACQELAVAMLRGGLRISELWKTCEAEEKVCGKGGKIRDIYAAVPVPRVSKSTLYRALKSQGLCPHDLRKAFASRLAQSGMRPEDLCEVMGWSSIETAYWYLRPQKREALAAQITQALE